MRGAKIVVLIAAALTGCAKGITVDLIVTPGCPNATTVHVEVILTPQAATKTLDLDYATFFAGNRHLVILPPDGTTKVRVNLSTTERGAPRGQGGVTIPIDGPGYYKNTVGILGGCQNGDGPLVDLGGADLALRTFVTATSGVNFDLKGVWGSDANDVYAVGLGATLLRSTDGCKTWLPQAGAGSLDLIAVWGGGPGDIYVVGDGGEILHSTGGGAPFTLTLANTSVSYRSVSGSSTGRWVVGSLGDIQVASDGGWAPRSSGTGQMINRVLAFSDSEVIAGGAASLFLASATGGATWTLYTISDGGILAGIDGTFFNVFIVGEHGLILHSTDATATWTAQASGTSQFLHDVWVAGSGEAWAVGEGATILRTDDDGATWATITSGTNVYRYFGVWGTADASLLCVVGDSGTILHSP